MVNKQQHEPEVLTFDIGGVYEVVMKYSKGGYTGHYTHLKTGKVLTFSAHGMSKKQILTRFWDRVKKMAA